MRVLLAQMEIRSGDKKHNLSKAIDIIGSHTADLYLFPELFTTGFEYSKMAELAEPLEGETTSKLAEACGNSLVGGTIMEADKKRIYNTFVLVSGDGIIGSYRKIHPFREEKEHFGSGRNVAVLDTKIGRLGLSTCYDVRFPELYRTLMKKGAQAALVSAEFPVPRQAHWDALIRARAIENQFFVLAVNSVGRDDKAEYFGSSQAIDPWGNVLAKAGQTEEFITVNLDPAEVDRTRRAFPVLGDIRLI